MKFSESLRRLLPGIWFGVLLAIALIATPAASGALDKASFGAVARAIFAREAPASLVFGVLILVIERRDALARHMATGASQFSVEMMLAAVTASPFSSSTPVARSSSTRMRRTCAPVRMVAP